MAEILILRLLVLVGAVIAGYYLYKYVTAPEKEDKEEIRLLKRVIEVSRSGDGRVTAADVAFSMDITLHAADELLTKLAAEGLAAAEINDQGLLEYDIPRARAETNPVKIPAPGYEHPTSVRIEQIRRKLGEK